MGADFQEQHKIETFKSAISTSAEVFKYLILLNGGAAAGMVAGIDKVLKIINISVVQTAMTCFVAGLVSVSIATFFAYGTQLQLHNENIDKARRGAHHKYVVISASFSNFSLAAFCTGALKCVFSLE